MLHIAKWTPAAMPNNGSETPVDMIITQSLQDWEFI